MMIVRPISAGDYESFVSLVFSTEVELPSLPKNRERLEQKISHSEESFGKAKKSADGGLYMFVLEDSETHTIHGTSGIAVTPAAQGTSYNYRIDKVSHHSSAFGVDKTFDVLTVVKTDSRPAEICALYLTPKVRKEGFGKLLSFSRFLYMATFPDRFHPFTMALMRGHVDDKGESCFWTALGRHFLDKGLSEAEAVNYRDKTLIKDLVPKYPVYLCLLPKEVQEVIGTPNASSKGAQKILFEEGFLFQNEIDIFDGGPKLIAKTNEIRSVKQSAVSRISGTRTSIDSPRYLVSNERIAFRACYSPLLIQNKEVILPQQTAQALQVSEGDKVRYIQVS